ncbi:MAG: metalloregulator ArsR/SmtB family transcription factor, partial [Pseudomonadota bacterium]
LLSQGELTVTELVGLLGQSQPRVSRHLKVLADAGLVDRYQEGAWGFYRLANAEQLNTVGIVPAAIPSLISAEDKIALEQLRAARAAVAASYFAQHAADWEAVRGRHIEESAIEASLLELAGEGGDTFVDLGTGTGRLLIVFRHLYRRAIGYDVSPDMLAVARAKLGEESITHAQVRRMDFLEDPLEDTADLICLHHVLHFLADPGEAIEVAAKALSPGGRLLIADFAPHTHEDLRDHHAHRRLGFRDTEIAEWAQRSDLSITATRHLDPPEADGIVTSIWRLERTSDQLKYSLSAQTDRAQHVHA